MNLSGWTEIALTLAVIVACAFPLGAYLASVWQGERTWLDPVFRPVERLVYAACGVKTDKSQPWFAYGLSFLAFSAASFVVLYLMLRFQDLLPLNPQGFAGLSPHLAFNTAVSFVSNTNWQSYVPEQTVSTFSQMAGMTSHNFLSAAAGMALAAVMARAFAANRGEGLGNFWVDLTRISLYVLLPIALVIAVAYVGLGEPQSLAASVTAHTVEGGTQTIALYPAASQEAIKQLGTNGGGVFNANSAHPFENPNAWTNLIEIVSMNALSLACVIAFGRIVLARKEARALAAVMVILVSAAAGVIYAAETQPPPALAAAGVDSSVNMEGKEVRFGAPSTAIWAAATTGASDGGVNAMHDSLMPLGGGMAMFLMQLGEILPGGVGSGLYGMVVMALIAVFVAGLMVGRTPEYLGKKVEAREIKYAMLAVLILPLTILGFSAVAAVLPVALRGLANPGAHGLSEILYAYTSAAANNGSAFAGLSANTPWWNTTLGISMLLGRFAYVMPVLAIAGSLAAKPKLAASTGTFPTDGPLFVGLLIGVILIMGGLQFFPALALGPIVEHFQALQAVASR
ncbi:MAG: potassium-transporting ATPase subunit KdpA [Alphaproteobacteria bacterium]|nr:potassium-transporting ATPase subunit KdpA [Alphaproteobacteria bacterium]MBU1516919.1 potassium-transporting ATPase subunit KdpA [Alphaproteobacteria bacterium]MBU2095807.1 potassium-transporting ATPase subunit KdpA [Alphaproteobacteria bacterium]MBU2152056.1 potassium-transporting ATPase subunit KdpA [Alphaproteobacteria bacterium]MBU2309577.1 potassium-transporting ATPase subunit KdpA [Alphaproteobacteria bacterium]